ncbi:hypothetical protein CI088_13675 [Enterococcus plantarum]|uniref:Uncharacterized protein n=1 Tax=Enterococcus plantarum TaxID=1077675 RepID=A0A2W3Z0Y2_9ENTE|nr:hypothetical protein [Enterococcus plantarum]PZL70930.1 hypothetical protein CI088_13675 [Enterococcus plantarum]
MFNDYFENEIQVMPSFLKGKYVTAIRSLIKDKKFSESKADIENIFGLGEGVDFVLKKILSDHNELFIEAYNNIEASMSLKYSALFELDDDRKVEEIISLITAGNSLVDSTIEFSSPVYEIKATSLKDMLKFTFLLQGIRIQNGLPIACKTTYSIIVKFWEFPTTNDIKKFVEIDADNVATYFRRGTDNFFEQMINLISNYLQTDFSLSLTPIDLFDVLETIKEKEKSGKLKNLPKASAQKMVLSSGSQAILDSNDAETIILPILGEIKKLIEDNEELFLASPDVKILLEGFISDTELMSDLPWITFTWDNKIKSKKIQVKFVLSDYPYTLLSYYSHTKGRSGMNDVVESLLKEYCILSTNGEEESTTSESCEVS